ncbi:10144_t:CDS:2 [Gigaspora margarita]|uniref:10144_t:CDS:1 n=1 Tax=Gigaspora margarita TaxID=4874 RepID=A0ABN7WBP1_GIGMA|nr:10144_t:CDS:2 [Gigaspora margarita]
MSCSLPAIVHQLLININITRKKQDNYSIAWDYFMTKETENSFFDIYQLCKKKNIIVKYVYNSLTGNMLGHLWSKHRIDKDHPDGMNTDGPIVKAMHIITKRRQEKLVQEALLTIKPILSPYTAKNIQSFLDYIIIEWEMIRRLSILKGLKPVAQFIKQAKNLILFFFQSPKQTERLNNAQEKNCESDKLSCSYATPFYDATTIFFGSNYLTFNLIYPTMKLLIKKFEPSDGQTENDYANLLFGPREQISDQSQFIANEEDSSESDIEYEFETPKPPITSLELHNLVKATSYFSLQEYWDVSDEIRLITSF